MKTAVSEVKHSFNRLNNRWNTMEEGPVNSKAGRYKSHKLKHRRKPSPPTTQ
jgi:hypothetical protein